MTWSLWPLTWFAEVERNEGGINNAAKRRSKAKREVRKLEDRANQAETYAADCIDYALITIDVAEEAIFDAVVARSDADAAESTPVKR